jgi:hypothetical protein
MSDAPTLEMGLAVAPGLPKSQGSGVSGGGGEMDAFLLAWTR